ncbi:MAG TPA: biotin carboxyl carrier protein [Candidatus Binatia bacterium]|nr:biotin carboxyl carrier protein [Candidatus Binatia bacterium]
MTQVRFVDTTLRDGQQSLWAYGMRTGMIVPVAEQMDAAGFEAIELGGPVELPKCVRELRENPWERYRLVIPQFRKTPLRLIHGTRSGFAIYPHALHQLYDTCMANAGVTEVRMSDSWNDPADWAWRVQQAKNAGLKPIINLIYTVSPRHTDEHYAQKIREAIALGIYRVILKDPGGILTPERTKTLAPAVLAAAGGTTVELHTHCTTGLGTLCCLEAIKAGMTNVNTAIPPLADGSSNPSIFNVAMNTRALGYETLIDEEPLRAVAKHFTACAKQDGLPIGKTPEYDYAQYVHQIPGGMISNLRHQLSRVGMENRIDETLEEAAQVRAEFGYPIMVTPLSQFVGSQAAINVIVGERYKEVTDQTIEYAMGIWGKEGAVYMDANVKEKILNRPRAKEIAERPHPTDSLQDLRRKYGGEGVSDEEVLLRFFTSEEDVERMHAAGPSRSYSSNGNPLLNLVAELSKQTDRSSIFIQRPNFSLRLEKRLG